ncbi:response regulator transcription factor [Devosia naphthalenivorans]|uniref:response regulator transcription factor n=1 Tax=Devosia naphthalenivorans TaxID=2082392 RepID=UPI000D33B6F5|nr:response regulator transcription factor [Devosia naphthalenivorans]
MAHQSAEISPVVLLLQDPIIIIDWMRILEEAGVEVRSAGSFEAASTVLGAEQGITHLVLDVGLHLGPSLSELLDLLKKRPHTLKVIVTSDRTADMDDLPADTVFLQKPVQPQTLIAAVMA